MKKTQAATTDATESQDLLQDKAALNSMINEGGKIMEQEFEGSESAEKTTSVQATATPELAATINIHSSNTDMKWYIVYVRTGMEMKAKQALENRIKTENMGHLVGQVFVPSENVIEMSKGKKRETTRKFFPGYMLVQMVMNENTWHFVKSTPKIVGFIGNSTNPPAVSEKELLKISNHSVESAVRPTPKVSFEEGETVRVTEGPFTNFTGIDEEVRPDKAKLRVLVSIFGRSTPVELDFVQVEKM
jgi:transcription termination/antitermination protein NusG